MKRVIGVVVVTFCLVLASCGGGGGSTSATTPSTVTIPLTNPVRSVSSLSSSGYPGEAVSCTIDGQKRWLDDYMADQYFWNANRATPNASATTLDAYFQSQLYVPTDRYSYTQAIAAFTQFFTEGTRTGYGYSLAFSDATQTKLQIRLIEPASPAAAAGLQRGDTVLAIDGFSPASIVNGSLTVVTTAGITRTFSLENAAGVQRTVNVVSRNFPLSPVLTDKVLTAANNAKVGYLAYQEFTNLSLVPLGAAFNRFRAAGVTELIVDLRYNGGGSVAVARALASMMGGTPVDGKVFASLRFNAQNAFNDFDYPFTASAAALPAAPLAGLTQVFFITSYNTASASELVINSLFPFKKVVTVGASTFGKPYGFLPISSCDTVYNAVNFETFNALGAGRYASGLPATCAVADDLSKALGDPAERRTAAALGYIQNNACPALAFNPAGDLQAKSLNDQSMQDASVANGVAVRRFLEPAFGELSQPGMKAD